MKSKATVTVIIPFFSGKKWLDEAIESVVTQTYKAHEIILVNDGSLENIDDIVEKYKGKIVYYYKNNGGPSTARNFGIEKSTGDYIAFLDSDDIWEPKKLEIQLTKMIAENAKWSHTSYVIFNDNSPNSILKTVDVKNFNGNIFPKMLSSNPLATPCIMIEGNLLRNNCRFRFNPAMRYGQDQYLWMILAQEYEILAIQECLTRVRIRGNNAALRSRVQLKAKSTIYKNVILNNNISINSFLKIAFIICSSSDVLIEKINKIPIINEVTIEFISKILYIIPYAMFKFYYFIG